MTKSFAGIKGKNKQAMDAIGLVEHEGIPISLVHIMQHEYIERIAGAEPGDYLRNPEETYIRCLKNIDVSVVDQYLALNPLRMGNKGFESNGKKYGGAVICDGVAIDSPEAVVDHLEKYEFPRLAEAVRRFNENERIKEIITSENEMQYKLGEGIMKTGYAYFMFPILFYSKYGYENYFMAYALYPEIIEKHFSLQAEYAIINNNAAIKAINIGNLSKLFRLDHDMADSRGILSGIKSLEKLWMPHFARCLAPAVRAGVKFIWHCDGNLMELIPWLLDTGIKGFQGFQYEDGMDYVKICRMKTRDNEPLIIWAGVSVTRTLPFGTPDDIKKEMRFLAENGPGPGLFLGSSSSITPGVPWKNIETLIEGLQYYKRCRRRL
ncbi:MAG: hypothetical protein JXB33_04035 [Clostridia bacterium]|nr:hypothetical protein [Clostridia bacterium]